MKSVSQHIHAFDVVTWRSQFPVLHQNINGKPLIYLDNGATSQKPKCVVDAISDFYLGYNANVHRGIHELADRATRKMEAARQKAKNFFNAQHEHEIIFTTGTTGGINLVAASFGSTFIQEGDEILISAMEHHSNIVPWQIICEKKGAKLKVIPMDSSGELVLSELPKLLTDRTQIVAVVHTSNSLGTINDIDAIIQAAHQKDIPVLIDAAQTVPHQQLDVRKLDCDFMVCSAHKMFGPTGIGILYGKEKWLNSMDPWLGGGEMIDRVTFEKTTYNSLPYKFEAGTPNIAGVIGLGEAFDFIDRVGYSNIQLHEQELLQYAHNQLALIPGIKFYGEAKQKASVVSFNFKGVHPSDLGSLLNMEGIAVRTGHHCTQPVMDFFEIPGTVRASFAFYNTMDEIDKLKTGIEKALKLLM